MQFLYCLLLKLSIWCNIECRKAIQFEVLTYCMTACLTKTRTAKAKDLKYATMTEEMLENKWIRNWKRSQTKQKKKKWLRFQADFEWISKKWKKKQVRIGKKKEGERANGGFVTLSINMYQVPGKRQANWQNWISQDKPANELPSVLKGISKASKIRASPDCVRTTNTSPCHIAAFYWC